MRAHPGDDHDGERHRRRDRGRQAKRQQQAGSRFGQSRHQRIAPAGNEAQLLEEAPRARQTVPAEPAEQLLRAVRGQRQADHQTQNQDSDTHVIASYLLVEWNYLAGSMITSSLPDVKGLSFGKCLRYPWHHDEAGGFPMPDVPDCDPGPGSLLECADPQCLAGGGPAVQRALRARQGSGGQGALGAVEGPGGARVAGAQRRRRPASAGQLRADEKRAHLRRPRAGDRALGARAHARGEATPAIKHNWSVITVSGNMGIEVGIDSFAAAYDEASLAVSPSQRLRDLVEQVEHADQVGLDVFGIGEHHRKDYLDSAPPIILAAAATRTRRIRLTSAVTVLSAADPVRVFQNFATLDLLSHGRSEIVAGRGSFIEAFPLFGLELDDYDSLFAEKLDLLLNIRENEHVHWSGRHRAALTGQGVYPRPVQNPLPIWLGVGGTPQSFMRAGELGLPLMVAIIGGETRRFRSLIDLYWEAAERAGRPRDQLKVGVHSLGYVAATTQEAADDFFPGYARAMNSVGRERGWPPMSRAGFDAQRGPTGALLIGEPDEVVEKIIRHSEALGGISRITFQMNASSLPHAKLMRAIEALGTQVAPALHHELAKETA